VKPQKYIVRVYGDVPAGDVGMMLEAAIKAIESKPERKTVSLDWIVEPSNEVRYSLIGSTNGASWRLDLQGPKAGDQ